MAIGLEVSLLLWSHPISAITLVKVSLTSKEQTHRRGASHNNITSVAHLFFTNFLEQKGNGL